MDTEIIQDAPSHSTKPSLALTATGTTSVEVLANSLRARATTAARSTSTPTAESGRQRRSSEHCEAAGQFLLAGDLSGAIASAERAVALAAGPRATPAGDDLVPHVVLADALVLAGRTRDALRVIAEGRLRFDRDGDRPEAVRRGCRRAALRDASVLCNFAAGNWDDALAEVGDVHVEHADVAWLSARAASSLGVLALHRGDLASATIASRSAWRRHAAGTDPVDGMYAAWLDTMLADQHGDAGDAFPWFTAVLEQLIAIDHAGPILPLLSDYTYVARRVDSVPTAQRMLDRLTDVFDRAACPAVDSVRLHTSAILSRSLDDAVRAVELSRESESPLRHLQTSELAGTIAIEDGDLVDARMYLETARVAAEVLGATSALRRVQAAQRRAGANPGARGSRLRQTTGWGALTRTEAAIAELMLAGMVNREIAERLYISRRTVESHVSSILRKMGVTNRSALFGCPARAEIHTERGTTATG